MKSSKDMKNRLLRAIALVTIVITGCASEESGNMNAHDHASVDSTGQSDAMVMDDMSSHSGHDMSSMAETTVRNDVHLSAAAIQSIGVRFASATTEALTHTVRTTGRFAMDEQAEYDVTLKTSGYVENLQADYNGKQVQQGEPLFDFYSPELVATQEELLTAARHLARLESLNAASESIERAERVVEAVKRRLSLWDVGEDLIESMLLSGEPLRVIPFSAPVSGEIMGKQVSEGSHVAAGQSVLRIVDISKTWLVVDIYEQDVSWIEVGTPAVVNLPYNPGFEYEGIVEYIYPMLNAELKTAQARIVLPSGDDSPFKPGMFATVTLHGLSEDPAVTVPTEALLRDGKSEFVILSLGEGMFRPIAVRSGVESEGRIQILEGLEGDEVVVSSAQFLIDSEAQLGSAMSSMMGMEH